MRKLIIMVLVSLPIVAQADQSLLNVSYDPTRELYEQLNANFKAYWRANTGSTVEIKMSHGGSSAQARAVIDGLEADVVTFGAASDIDALHDHGNLLSADWQSKLPHTSTVVFLVRQGNPKNIRDWNDLIRPGVGVITPNPKTSAGARWNFLAAYAYAHHPHDPQAVTEFVKALYQHVPVLSTGSRAATLAFTQQARGEQAWRRTRNGMVIRR
jgi:sulfate/thiosulfate transport system substrate-binding protein